MRWYSRSISICLLSLLTLVSETTLAQTGGPAAAQAWGKTRPAVTVQPDGLYVCEAEEFRVTAPPAGTTGWVAKRWGENYYAATFANSFLSRKAFLGAPEQCDHTAASINVDIKHPGRYLVLVRYEAVYRFETQFHVRIEQGGRKVFDRRYGARNNLKIWAFGQQLKTEVGWSWGAAENVVWEGHDAFVDLEPGRATIRLLADRQPEPAARRNIDLVMLTTDVQQVKMRIEKENYLPLDGMLTQSGDVWLRVTNLGRQPLAFQGRGAPSGGNWQQHSPYWVHLRNWQTPSIEIPPGKTSDWVEVGGTMDSLNDGQWFWTGDGRYRAEFGLKVPSGRIEAIGTFTGQDDLTLGADADTRYSRRLRKLDQVLYDLLDYLKRENPAPHGRTPQRTTIYGYTFDPLDDGKHAAAVAEFKRLFALADTKAEISGGRGYIDVRGVSTEKLPQRCRDLGDKAKNIAVVSLGDEIRLPRPGGDAAAEEFRRWLESRRLTPSDLDPTAGGDWGKITYSVDPQTKDGKPGLYYWSRRYQYHYGIQAIKRRTDILRRHLPNAGIGANYSPHYPQEHMFLGEVFKWVTVFREDGMTLPWSEDYIWQVPIGTPQMNNINLDLFRAALRHRPDRKILYYVMPHMPNNTPRQWRRLFYGALAHGMKIVDLFEFRPVHVAYTENHVDDPAMYKMVLGSFRELGLFEDIVQDGRVRSAEAALWFSETGDIWGDSRGSFAAAKRALYTAIRHRQIPLDFVVEQDALDGTLAKYKVLYLTDAHVSSAASQRIAAWVHQGGVLLATAGAGMFDELNRPNKTLRQLLGVEQTSLDAPQGAQVIWIKQDLPFVKPIQTVKVMLPVGGAVAGVPPSGDAESADAATPKDTLPVFCVRSRIRATSGETVGSFSDGSAAIVSHQSGKGRTLYCAFLPGLSYYKPAIPLRPVDRGATDDAMIHFLPTDFDPLAARLIALPAASLKLPVRCNQPLVETTIIQSPHGVVIPLVNWSGRAEDDLRVSVNIPLPSGRISVASGLPIGVRRFGATTELTFEMDVADAIIVRR